jgi:hypothetical protein
MNENEPTPLRPGHAFKGEGDWCQFLYAGADGECLGPCLEDRASHEPEPSR